MEKVVEELTYVLTETPDIKGFADFVCCDNEFLGDFYLTSKDDDVTHIQLLQSEQAWYDEDYWSQIIEYKVYGSPAPEVLKAIEKYFHDNGFLFIKSVD